MTKEKDKNKLAEEILRAQTIQEEQNRQMLLEANMKSRTGKVESDSDNEFAVTFVTDDNWQKILAKYKQLKNAKEIEDNVLAFATMEDAKCFFTELAADGVRFLATKVENGKPVDQHFFSCGDNQIYEGSYAEILGQLQNAQKLETAPEKLTKIISGIEYIKSAMPKSESNPAAEMRSKLQKVTVSDTEASSDKVPNPFK